VLVYVIALNGNVLDYNSGKTGRRAGKAEKRRGMNNPSSCTLLLLQNLRAGSGNVLGCITAFVGSGGVAFGAGGILTP